MIPLLVVPIAYFAAATAGLLLSDTASESITLFWLPSGIAVWATARYGERMLPGVWVAAAVTNLLFGGAAPVAALLMAFGNTTEAMVGARLLTRYGIFYAAAAPLIAASVGVAALYLTGAIDVDTLFRAAIVYWLGDALGILALVPLADSWRRKPPTTEAP